MLLVRYLLILYQARGLGTTYHILTFITLMIICDNATRWNSAYLSIKRGLILESKIRAFSTDFKYKLDADFIILSD